MSEEFDPVWDTKYKGGHAEKYPWDSVVSFLFRHSRGMNVSSCKVLELGCGTGSNLWFAAREGFQTVGIDASLYAIEYGIKRFRDENLPGEFFVSSFLNLPFEENSFDFIIDRAALACVGKSQILKTIQNIWKLLKPGGKFLFTPYSKKNTSYITGTKIEDDLVIDILEGSLVGVGQICFFDEKDIFEIFGSTEWTLVSFESIVRKEYLTNFLIEEFQVVAEKMVAISNV